MSKLRTVDDVIAALPKTHPLPLPAPPYNPPEKKGREGMLAVESMRRHTTDEGWQIAQALEHAGYELCGFKLGTTTDVAEFAKLPQLGTLVVQDKREWVGRTAGLGFDQRERFTHVEALRERPDIFKLTVLKDAQHDPLFHREAAEEMGCHAWITYYHPRIVAHLASYVRPQHLVRTWHTLDAKLVPGWLPGKDRQGVILSGAVSGAYPLRKRLFADPWALGGDSVDITALKHPGYGRNKCHTPEFLRLLGQHKVSICTSSIYGYSLRKIAESVACGCIVVTDLPVDDVMPGIDEALVRISSDSTVQQVAILLRKLVGEWDEDKQRHFAVEAQSRYDYHVEGVRLASAIEDMRRSYNDKP